MNIFDFFNRGCGGGVLVISEVLAKKKKTITGNLPETNSDDLEYFLQAVYVDNEGNIAPPIDQLPGESKKPKNDSRNMINKMYANLSI